MIVFATVVKPVTVNGDGDSGGGGERPFRRAVGNAQVNNQRRAIRQLSRPYLFRLQFGRVGRVILQTACIYCGDSFAINHIQRMCGGPARAPFSPLKGEGSLAMWVNGTDLAGRRRKGKGGMRRREERERELGEKEKEGERE